MNVISGAYFNEVRKFVQIILSAPCRHARRARKLQASASAEGFADCAAKRAFLLF